MCTKKVANELSVKKKSYLVNFYNKKFKINEDICILSARAYYKDNHVVINTGQRRTGKQ